MQEAAEKNDVFLKKCCDEADADLLEQEQENVKLLETIKQLQGILQNLCCFGWKHEFSLPLVTLCLTYLIFPCYRQILNYNWYLPFSLHS